jgi:hypothetical protein
VEFLINGKYVEAISHARKVFPSFPNEQHTLLEVMGLLAFCGRPVDSFVGPIEKYKVENNPFINNKVFTSSSGLFFSRQMEYFSRRIQTCQLFTSQLNPTKFTSPSFASWNLSTENTVCIVNIS